MREISIPTISSVELEWQIPLLCKYPNESTIIKPDWLVD